MIPRVLFLNVNLEANIPPNIREDVASKPNRNAYNIVVKRASGATSPKRFVFGTGGRIRQSTRKSTSLSSTIKRFLNTASRATRQAERVKIVSTVLSLNRMVKNRQDSNR